MNQALMIFLLALGAHSSSAVGLPEMNPVVRVQQQDSQSILSARELAHVSSLDSLAVTHAVPKQKVSVIKLDRHEREINQLYLRDLAKQMEQTEIQSDGTAERLIGSVFPKTKEGKTRKC